MFGDIEGKLDVPRVECTKCERKGRYSVAKLITKHGRNGNGDCPKRDGRVHDRCDLIFPDLSKVL